MTDFQTGLMISLIGLLVTFSALGIFIGIIVLLQKLFPAKKQEKPEEIVAPVEPVAIVESETGEEEITAALAALAFLRAQRAGQLGASLLEGAGPYRTSRP